MKKLIKNSNEGKTVINYVQFVVISAVTSVVLLLTACQKEPIVKVVAPDLTHAVNKTSAGDVVKKTSLTTTYSSCGMSVNVFSPLENSSTVYSFAYTVNGQQKRFGIKNAGQMDFSNFDKFSFEFAGYLDSVNLVKYWRIRRADGKYLTKGLKYADKLTGAQQTDQFFLLSSLGNNQYKLLLPKLPVCNLAAIWYDIDLGYRIANFEYNDSHLAGKDTKIVMTIVPLSNN